MFFVLFKYIEKFGLAILSIFSLFLLGRNSYLSRKNRRLNSNLKEQSHSIEIQKKVIDVAKNTKPTDIDGNLERMRERKL